MRKLSLFGPIVTSLIVAAPAYAMTDKDFLSTAIQGDISEATVAQVAGQMGGTAAIKSAGNMMEGDHEKARVMAEKLADLRGLTPPKAPSPDAVAEAGKLKALTGAAFDKEFADFMVKDHQKAIAMYKQEAASGKGPVARYAEMTLPTLEKHLKMAESLAQNDKSAMQ